MSGAKKLEPYSLSLIRIGSPAGNRFPLPVAIKTKHRFWRLLLLEEGLHGSEHYLYTLVVV